MATVRPLCGLRRLIHGTAFRVFCERVGTRSRPLQLLQNSMYRNPDPLWPLLQLIFNLR